MEAVEVSARFALPPNSRKYCGRTAFADALAEYLEKKSAKSRAALENELKNFVGHYPALRLIAKASGKGPFGAGVPEALWLGNGLLQNVTRRGMQQMILHDFCGKGKLSKKKAEGLAENMPAGFLPHHSFHVLYLGTITDVIQPSVKNADLCRPSWGEITGVRQDSATVRSQKLVKRKGRLMLVPCTKKVRLSCSGIRLIPDAKKGDWIACHWGVGVMKLSGKQVEKLEKVTMHNIAAANRMGG